MFEAYRFLKKNKYKSKMLQNVLSFHLVRHPAKTFICLLGIESHDKMATGYRMEATLSRVRRQHKCKDDARSILAGAVLCLFQNGKEIDGNTSLHLIMLIYRSQSLAIAIQILYKK